MDNQQAIATDLALGIKIGLYLGEGHFSVGKWKRANGQWQFTAEVGFSNSDPALLNHICDFLDAFPVGYHISQNANGCYQVKIQNFDGILQVLDVIEPHLFGNKKGEAGLLRRFIIGRNKARGGRGSKLSNAERSYTSEDHAVVEEKRLLRESSETIRFTRKCLAKI
jgi:hypothetical protein